MNLKNLMMWGLIVLLVVGLFQLFQNPKQSMVLEKTPFSEFLKNIDDGRVVQVEIKGNNIEGILSDGTAFSTYAPNDPNLVEKLTSKGVSITATPIEDKMPSLLGILLSWFPMLLLIGVWIFFMRQMQGGKGGAMGFGKSKAKRAIQALRDLTQEAETEGLLDLAIKRSSKRVIVKRHKNSKFLEDIKPSHSIKGKVVRYDIYNSS